MNALNFGVKRSKFKVTVEYHAGTVTAQCTGGGIHYSTSRVELDFLLSLCRMLYMPNSENWRYLKPVWTY